jgi:hypothetical protein
MPNRTSTQDLTTDERFAPDTEPRQTGRDAPTAAQYPYTDLRPEARGEVTPDNPGRLVGDDATAGFDNGPSNPTEHASSESLAAATDVARDSTTEDDEDMHALHTEDSADDTHNR